MVAPGTRCKLGDRGEGGRGNASGRGGKTKKKTSKPGGVAVKWDRVYKLIRGEGRFCPPDGEKESEHGGGGKRVPARDLSPT